MQAQSATMQRGATRLRFLDGLRGWAAVVVLLHHVFIDGLPANALMADRSLWAKVFFLNGTLAVSVFFVISGFSLSIRYLETGNGSALGRIAAGRYLRLALPIFAIWLSPTRCFCRASFRRRHSARSRLISSWPSRRPSSGC
jgi:peptidoglycan/LPS O-acetylase OafA/YrhL